MKEMCSSTGLDAGTLNCQKTTLATPIVESSDHQGGGSRVGMSRRGVWSIARGAGERDVS